MLSLKVVLLMPRFAVCVVQVADVLVRVPDFGSSYLAVKMLQLVGILD